MIESAFAERQKVFVSSSPMAENHVVFELFMDSKGRAKVNKKAA